MENSFYYFFSSAAQVLAGILALFGVFVIFKVQALTTELTSTASKLQEFATSFSDRNDDNTILTIRHSFQLTLKTWIQSRNISKIKYILDMNADDILKRNIQFNVLSVDFNQTYDIYANLIKHTIRSTVFTGFILLFCLAIIPFGKWIVCLPYILFPIFITTIISIVVSFRQLYLILKKSLNSSIEI